MSSKASSRAVTPGYVGLLRNREFAGVLLGTGVSVIGDQLARVALVILVYHRTDSPLLSSATYAATFIPVVVGTPLLGGLADRLPRRLVVISTDLVRAALFALMAIPGMPVWGVLVLLVVAVTAEAPWNAARGALMRDVVGSDEEYQLGTSLDETVYLGGQILGFALSGILLVVITPSTALLLDAVTFVVAGIIVRAVVSDRPASDPAAGTDPASATRSASRVARWTGRLRQGVADARLGLRVALAPGPRRPLLLTWTGISLAIAPEALAVAWVDQIHGGSLGVGLMYSTAPLGSVVGMLFVARLPVERGQHLLLPLAVLSLLPLLAAPVAQHLPWALALVFLSGVGTSYSMLARVAFVRRLDNAHRGRAYSIAAAGVTAGQGLGIALAGSAASLTDPALAVCLTAGLGLLLVAWVEVAAREPRGSLSGPAETA